MSGPPHKVDQAPLRRQVLLYSILTLLAVGGYGLLVSGLSLVLGNTLGPTNPLLVGLVMFLVAASLNPVRMYLQTSLDRVFDREQRAYDGLLQNFGSELPQAVELSDILELLGRYLQEGLNPHPLHIFLYDPPSQQYLSPPLSGRGSTTDLHFPVQSNFIRMLAARNKALILQAPDTIPSSLQDELDRLAVLNCRLFIPLAGRQKLSGWIAMGASRIDRDYNPIEIRFLEGLAEQAALALERAQVIADLERRVREMNVLSRVAQGTNFTVNFDDLLELIYAQTCQVIPAHDFRVMLWEAKSELLVPVFYLEDDERVIEREHKPLSDQNGLENEVVSTQHALFVSDYEQECRQRAAQPLAPGRFAWMGVPLNAGAETIGVISVASRDISVVYSEDQLSLLQSIADQAAGAIVKSRLLQETERRAHHLATLNEIGRSLTSTLDPNTLLNQIVRSAIDILNCTAGSLLLVDPDNGDLVFEVAFGPVASDLVGKRLPQGTGLAGEAVQSAKAIIANDARRRKEWFEKTDQQTGFQTQDLLVVPMLIQDRVIGVIEVINKQDDSPFTLADQELLTTFTSQATVAIENARLYTLTDKALAARVEELSVMQRIDQELNGSLDMERAIGTTLAWAMRMSGAEAGLVGIVEEEHVRVITSSGFPEDRFLESSSSEPKFQYLPRNLTLVERAIRSGQTQSAHPGEGEPPGTRWGLFDAVHSQVVVPIRRESSVMGLLLLESRNANIASGENLNFLSRLSDHAAIAIANAQLYGEVQAANLAKSKFVSFVAHELKNPMASIKGYTELVANGMAGPVNEMQSSFLATVRSNVDRMNTIVSDLNDLTKIQVGSLRLEFKAVDCKNTLDEVVRSLHKQIQEKEQQLVFQLPETLPPVWADPLRLEQVLTNLISNAHKYTPQNGTITIGAECWKAAEAGLDALEMAHLWVKDTGIGIPTEDQPKIFQQYFRTEISKETASGTGLGLNITRSLIEMQGGRIWFESQAGEGTTFHLMIPIAESN